MCSSSSLLRSKDMIHLTHRQWQKHIHLMHILRSIIFAEEFKSIEERKD